MNGEAVLYGHASGLPNMHGNMTGGKPSMKMNCDTLHSTTVESRAEFPSIININNHIW